MRPFWALLVAQLLRNLSAIRETWVQSLGWEDTLEKGKANIPPTPPPVCWPGEFHWSSQDGQYWNQIYYILCSQRWRSSRQSAKTRPGADCGSDHELPIPKFRLKLKKVGKTTRPFRYCKTQNSGLRSKEETPRDPINQPSRCNTQEGLLSVVQTGDSDLLGGRAHWRANWASFL